ncbi:DEAD/DEAH box helicase [Sporosarcina beigongshangi]|uniref:hypothetical protein n=1 Tax=Sporosarcina beigongshangi TaxID=2782538 RepID=UPI001939E66B|nr:hypothetical protein [Sporosarcina beigongshangi]
MMVTDLVTIDEINKWKQGDIITIAAGTGKGKSYFIKNILYAIAKRDNKRILMLIHRRNCTEQFRMELEEADKLDVIDIKTYQSIEAVERSGVIYELSQYDYIVCDEFHYFMSDAAFNKYTDISLNTILEQSRAIRIFTSATGDYVKHYLNDEKHKGISTIDYNIPINFDFIRHLEFYHKDETLETYIEQAIAQNKKAIFFIQSVKKAYELHERYKEHSLFNCSKNNKDGYYQYVDEEKITSMLKNERFEELILITTTVMDAGVNIVDDELNHIVADVNDTGTLIQCIGRKRLKNKKDHIILHLKAISNMQLGGMETQARKRLDMALYFREYGEKKFVREYYREVDNSHIVYDEVTEEGIEKRLNEMMFFKNIAHVNEINEIKKFKKSGYIKYIAKLFRVYRYSVYEEEEKKDDLESYLNSIVGKKLFKEGQKELIEKVRLKDGRGRIQKGISLLNAYFKENKMCFMIKSKRSIEIVNDKEKRVGYWEVEGDIKHD